MKEKLSIERLWSLGQFNNLRVEKEVTEIPESILSNPEKTELLSYYMLLSIEKAYRKYLKLQNDVNISIKNIKTVEDALQMSIDILQEEQTNTFNELFQEFTQEGQSENKKSLDKGKEK